jgi:hypothetical protein
LHPQQVLQEIHHGDELKESLGMPLVKFHQEVHVTGGRGLIASHRANQGRAVSCCV